MSELQPAKQLSKLLFGRGSRLAIWNTVLGFHIDPPEPFREKEVFDRMGPDANKGMIGRELGTLVAEGAIAPMPELGTLSSLYYRRLASTLWPVVAELASRTVELSPAPESEQ